MAEQAQVTTAPAAVPDDEDRQPTLHGDLIAIITATVLSSIKYEAVAEAVHAAVRFHMGGRRVYVPMTDAKMVESEIRTRDEAVRRAFNGRNQAEVCKAFGLSRASFYRAINPRARKIAKKRAHQAGGPRRG